jgi:hypothetical protein
MQVVIDQVVSQITAVDSDLSPETLRRIVRAVLEGLKGDELRRERVAEETSLRNYQQRNQPWTR